MQKQLKRTVGAISLRQVFMGMSVGSVVLRNAGTPAIWKRLALKQKSATDIQRPPG